MTRMLLFLSLGAYACDSSGGEVESPHDGLNSVTILGNPITNGTSDTDTPTPPTLTPTATPPSSGTVLQVFTYTGSCSDQYVPGGLSSYFDYVWPVQLAVGDHAQVTLYQEEHSQWDAWANGQAFYDPTESAVLVTSTMTLSPAGDITSECYHNTSFPGEFHYDAMTLVLVTF